MTFSPNPTLSRRRSQRGSVILLVFALIAVLTYLVTATFKVVNSDVEFSMARKKGFRCRQLAESGLNVAMNPAVQRWDNGLLRVGFPPDQYERYDVVIRGEGGKININALIRLGRDDNGRNFIDEIFQRLGVGEEKERRELLARLIDWTDEDDGRTEGGMEKDQYEELGIFGYPFNRPFYSLMEAPLVPGFDRIVEANADWKDLFTIYSQGRIDINEASAKVLAITTGTTEADAMKLVEKRWGDDRTEDTEDDAAAKIQSVGELALAGVEQQKIDNFSQYFTTNDTTTRIESVGTVGDFRKRIVVVVRSRQGQPQILMREEIPLF
jgi:general secretion pathway protein K